MPSILHQLAKVSLVKMCPWSLAPLRDWLRVIVDSREAVTAFSHDGRPQTTICVRTE